MEWLKSCLKLIWNKLFSSIPFWNDPYVGLSILTSTNTILMKHYKAFSAVKCRAVAYIPLTIMAVPASILTVSLNSLWWFLILTYRFVSHHSVLSPFTASAWGWLLIWVAHWHCCWFYWCNCWSWGCISSWKNSKFLDCFSYWQYHFLLLSLWSFSNQFKFHTMLRRLGSHLLFPSWRTIRSFVQLQSQFISRGLRFVCESSFTWLRFRLVTIWFFVFSFWKLSL